MQQPQRTLGQWADLIRRAAAPGLPREIVSGATAAWIAGFSDSAGHRRGVDRPLLSRLTGLSPGEMPRENSPDALAWWSLTSEAAFLALGVDWTGDGPLFPAMREDGIETWTESELSGVHALAWRGVPRRDDVVRRRVERAAVWLVANLQPDNATHRPWGVGVFAAMSADAERPDVERAAASLYAQSLVHNTLVAAEKPDGFSACILWDAAAWLDAVR